ncbi:MAG: hypothetical protein ACREYC_23455 [Gammaproteobacteria bacterium]
MPLGSASIKRRSRLLAALKPGDSAVLLVGALAELLQLLRTEGYQLVGSTSVRDGAIVHAAKTSPPDGPRYRWDLSPEEKG